MSHFSIFSLARNAMSYHENWQKQWRSPTPKSSYDAIIVGGGGHGLATAYYLGKNHGRIVATTETKIAITEIVPNGVGGWIERPRTIKLTEQ